MNIKEIQNAGIELFDAESENDFSSPKNWKKTFKTIELSLKDFGDDSNSAQILSKITNMINVLVRYGLVSEDIVLETAQLYVFIKEAGLDIEVLKQSYSEFVIEGVSCLCMQNLNDIKTHVFENEKYRYLGKIKIAEYIVELASKNKDKSFLSEVDEVINIYKNKSNNKLMNMLIEARK